MHDGGGFPEGDKSSGSPGGWEAVSRGCSGRVRLSQGSGRGGCVRATSHLSLPENELEEAQVGGETEAWHRPLRSSALCGRPREPVRGSEQGRGGADLHFGSVDWCHESQWLRSRWHMRLWGRTLPPPQLGGARLFASSLGRPWGLAFVAGLQSYHGPMSQAAREPLGDSGPGGLTPWGHRQGPNDWGCTGGI